ncbi:MAG: 1,4-alpha-glucan branching protein GlgB [Tissierellia bacterium]|nr:1,4-alpha-glucan branching protein GlgB [Tissierellia bacterium]
MKINAIDTDFKKIEDYLYGINPKGYEIFGAIKDGDYYIFRLFAPKAESVYIRGDFTNRSDILMFKNKKYGYHFIKLKAKKGDYYKYLVKHNDNYTLKADPFAKSMDLRPEFATEIIEDDYNFSDQKWLKKRTKNYDRALNIYELHLGSWQFKEEFNNILNIADSLISYVKKMNYTHIELMPICEHPLDQSWGYQVTGYFSFTKRYGSPRDLKEFVDLCHNNEIGVIMDFVPVHFATDSYGLGFYDGESLYESDYKDLQYSQWGSLNFDYSKTHVRNFILSSIDYWISQFHFDGIRLDAISNMIYYDGKENRGENEYNISFLKQLNTYVDQNYKDVMMIAEDSSSYNTVCKNKKNYGLGFDYKWDLGWMNDTIRYFKMDSFYRSNFQNLINFSMFYFYNERYILPLSHDEVVHLKKSMIGKMSGSYEDKFKQLKLFFIYQMTHPGKKLNFMGNEFAMFDEWNERKSLSWNLFNYPTHDSYNRLVKDMNYIYKNNEAFYKKDYDQDGFLWNVVDDNINSVFSYIRSNGKDEYFICLNMTNTYKSSYEFKFDKEVKLKKVLSTLDEIYGGDRRYENQIITSKDTKVKVELWEYEAIIFKIEKEEENG